MHFYSSFQLRYFVSGYVILLVMGPILTVQYTQQAVVSSIVFSFKLNSLEERGPRLLKEGVICAVSSAPPPVQTAVLFTAHTQGSAFPFLVEFIRAT